MAPPDPSIDTDYRRGVGIMLLNRSGEVFVARRIDFPDETWQMPQGGIADGEEPHEAAFRELREEIGTDKAEIVAESAGWLRYELPDDIIGQKWKGRWRGQQQKWYVMRFTGTDADIDLDTEHPEFKEWKWAAVSQLPAMVVSFKRQVYLDLLGEFPKISDTLVSLSELLADPIIRKVMAADRVREREIFDLLRQALGGSK
jgi:putative (di)nucleoside polyphosphate hydrolase